MLGETVEVEIPQGAKEQDKIVISKKGYVNAENVRGDLILHINIKHPETISERERKIYEQLLRVEKQQKEKQRD